MEGRTGAVVVRLVDCDSILESDLDRIGDYLSAKIEGKYER